MQTSRSHTALPPTLSRAPASLQELRIFEQVAAQAHDALNALHLGNGAQGVKEACRAQG